MQRLRDRRTGMTPDTFQYPQSDRRRCNCCAGRTLWPSGLLSVSSIGSEAMQQVVIKEFRNEDGAFSILNRIGGDATFQLLERERVTDLLSVSSIGSEAMQQSLTQSVTNCFPTSFSILNRIGGDATGYPFRPLPRTGGLSVSSIGSEAMQLYGCSGSDHVRVSTFSILNRIGGDATLKHFAPPL